MQSRLEADSDKREKALVDAQHHTALLASIVDSSDDAIMAKSTDGTITSWNRGAEAIYGYSAQEIVGKRVALLIDPETPGEMDAIIGRIKNGERIEHYETTRIRKDGKAISVSLTVSPILNEAGTLTGFSSIARDITELKLVQEQARETSQYARSLIEASFDPLVTISPDGTITDVNEATIKVTGLTRETLIGTDFCDYFTEPSKAREKYLEAFSKGSVSDYPLTIHHKGGGLTDVLYNATVYRSPQGNVLGAFAAARDVTVQKQASQYARSLIEASVDTLVTISPEGRITDVNEATIKVTGVPRETLIGTDFSDYFAEPEKARDAYHQVFSKGFVTDHPLTIRSRGGLHTHVLYSASVYKDVRGGVLGVFAAARDVTAQKNAEAQIAEVRTKELERLAELERFQKLTVGRELKMIELKKEIEELKRTPVTTELGR